MKEETYYVFEIENSLGIRSEHFFSSNQYFNEGVPINSLTLLHVRFDDANYYLFYGKKGFRGGIEFSFQYNAGNDFTELLKNNGATYHRYDVADVLESSYLFKFKLKNGQRIQFETYANGTTSGLMIWDVSDPKEKGTLLSDLPIAKLKLESKNNEITLKSKEVISNIELPDSFKEHLEGKKWNTTDRYFMVGIIVIITLLLYYFLT